jgi:integrase
MGVTATQPEQVAPGKWAYTINLPRAADGRYPKRQVTVHCLNEQGKPLGTRAGRKLADEDRAEKMRTVNESRCKDPRKLTFAVLAQRWLDAEEAETQEPLQPVTLEFYRINLERYVLPSIGQRIAAELAPADVTALLAKYAHLSKSSRKHLKATVSAVCGWAVDERLMDWNPAQSARRKSRRKRQSAVAAERERPEFCTWDPDEIAKAVALACGRLVLLPLMFGGWCGLRRGEVCGLRWEDIDLEAGTVSVSRAVEQLQGGELHVSPPKSEAGYRTVPMPDALCETLRQHRAVQKGLALKSRPGKPWNPLGYVVTTLDGRPVKPRNLSSAWAEFCRVKKLRAIRYHDLRHSWVTDLLLRQGESPAVVARLAGHSDPYYLIRTYCHSDAKMHKDAGIRQNERVTAAMEKVSRLSRDVVRPLREAAG